MSDTIHTDTLHVIHARAAGLDSHNLQITATVRLARLPAKAQPHPPYLDHDRRTLNTTRVGTATRHTTPAPPHPAQPQVSAGPPIRPVWAEPQRQLLARSHFVRTESDRAS